MPHSTILTCLLIWTFREMEFLMVWRCVASCYSACFWKIWPSTAVTDSFIWNGSTPTSTRSTTSTKLQSYWHHIMLTQSSLFLAMLCLQQWVHWFWEIACISQLLSYGIFWGIVRALRDTVDMNSVGHLSEFCPLEVTLPTTHTITPTTSAITVLSLPSGTQYLALIRYITSSLMRGNKRRTKRPQRLPDV